MIKKKICLLGDFGVGKTSLIRQYVLNVYSEDYLTTIGVVISKKEVVLPSGTAITLVLWDLEGHEDFSSYSDSYLRGMAGYILVADGTRPETLESVRRLKGGMRKNYADIPSLLLLNKSDLSEKWKLKADDYRDFQNEGMDIFNTSAKTGISVNDSFLSMAGNFFTPKA